MPFSAAKLGLFVPLKAKSDKVSDIVNFINAGRELLEKEPETLQWYGVQFAGEEYKHHPTFAIFDTFAAEGGRGAHLSGEELLYFSPPAGLMRGK